MLEILEVLHPGGKYQAPTWRVRCPVCALPYATTAWLAQIRETPSCKSCQMKGNTNGRRHV